MIEVTEGLLADLDSTDEGRDTSLVIKTLRNLVTCLIPYSLYDLNYKFFHTTDMLSLLFRAKDKVNDNRLNVDILDLLNETSKMHSVSMFLHFNRIGGLNFLCDLAKNLYETASEKTFKRILNTMVELIEFEEETLKSGHVNEFFKNNMSEFVSQLLNEKNGIWEETARSLEKRMRKIYN